MGEFINASAVYFKDHNILVDLVTMAAAVAFGFFQWRISARMKKIEDYVCLVAVPDGDKIKFINTGKVNLYIWKYVLPLESYTYERGRLIPANTNDAYFWLPAKIGNTLGEFEFSVYLKDQDGNEVVADFGGNIDSNDQGKIEARVWSYSTEVKKWHCCKCNCC